MAMVLPPATLPSATAVRETGATITSFKNPNSRSHTIDTAEKIEVNKIVIARMPGNMNCRKSTPPPPKSDIAPDRPPPKTNRNSKGWPIDTTIRIRSRKKQTMSRYQMV